MSTTDITVPAAAANSSSEIVFTVADGDIVKAVVAKVKNMPERGILVSIAGNPMAFMPNGCVAGKNDKEKAARRAELLANAGCEISVAVMGAPTVETIKGKKVGRIKVSEQRAVMAAERAERASQDAARASALEAAVGALEAGSVVEGTVKSLASKESTREPGTQHVYGAFVKIGDDLSGLLHVREIAGGQRALDALVPGTKLKVEIVSAAIENGRPRIQLSQSSVGLKLFFDQYPVGAKVKGKVVRTGEVAGNLHGRIIELGSGAKVFLCDDDMNVKSETSLARNNTTTVVITGDVVGGMVRVTRRGA